MTNKHKNWAGNLHYGAQQVHHPQSIAEAQALVASREHIRAFGSRHSFNDIADSTADHISLERAPQPIEIDSAAHTVRVSAGMKYGDLALELHHAGFALHNMASLPHISVAGAVATATHGSGDGNGNLATAVVGLELIDAKGEVKTYSRAAHAALFDGLVVGLGATGIVTALELRIEPAFTMRQSVHEDLPVANALANFDTITASAYSVSLFWDWNPRMINQVWRKQRIENAAHPAPFGAHAATRELHPLSHFSAEPCTPQMGVSGPWHERLPHFRMGFTPSSGEELQSEYFIPREHAAAALQAVQTLHARIAPLLMISEIRTVAADALWMSTAFGRETVAIHFTWKPDWPQVRALLPDIERALEPFQPRPHWGKLFTLAPSRIQATFPKLMEFRALLQQIDPTGKFRNEFVTQNVFEEQVPG